jgi:hypothetical protein
MRDLADRARSISKKAEALSKLTGAVQQRALMPYLERAVAANQGRAQQMIMSKLEKSGLSSHTGELKSAIKRVKLVLKWGKGADLRLVVPSGLPESMYKRIWSLDKGWKINGEKTHPWKCFTLTPSEKRVLGAQITQSAINYMRAEERSKHAG